MGSVWSVNTRLRLSRSRPQEDVCVRQKPEQKGRQSYGLVSFKGTFITKPQVCSWVRVVQIARRNENISRWFGDQNIQSRLKFRRRSVSGKIKMLQRGQSKRPPEVSIKKKWTINWLKVLKIYFTYKCSSKRWQKYYIIPEDVSMINKYTSCCISFFCKTDTTLKKNRWTLIMLFNSHCKHKQKF